jgi:ABC-type sulfate/molybdate transport systems ATPase subunit
MIELVKVKKFYGARCALDVPALSIKPGERLALIGPNGSGKSTLLRLIAGVIRPEEGVIRLDGISRGEIAYLPQKPYGFDLSVRKNVELALDGAEDAKERACAALELVGLSHLQKESGSRLSGGETQRMALARVIARPRKVLLLDEPTASADIRAIDQMERVLADYLERTGCALVFSSHAPAQAMRLSTRVAALDDGTISELGRTEQVLRDPKAESTRLFLRYWNI